MALMTCVPRNFLKIRQSALESRLLTAALNELPRAPAKCCVCIFPKDCGMRRSKHTSRSPESPPGRGVPRYRLTGPPIADRFGAAGFANFSIARGERGEPRWGMIEQPRLESMVRVRENDYSEQHQRETEPLLASPTHHDE